MGSSFVHLIRPSLIKDITQFKMQGQIISVNNSTISGPRRVETKVVSRGSIETKTQTMIVHFLFLVFSCLGLL